MTDGIDRRREAEERPDWVEVDHLPVCPKNGMTLTNGRALPNGGGLTSGPGKVNGLAFTTQTPELDDERRPTGFHSYSARVTKRWPEFIPRGLGVRQDLINGFSIEKERPRWEPPKKHWWSPRRNKAPKRRMAELAETPMPGDDTN